MGEPPDIESHVHVEKERLEHGWQCLLQKQGCLTIADQELLQETMQSMESMRQDEMATSATSSSAACSSETADLLAAAPCGGAATFSTASAVAGSVPGRGSAAAHRLALLRANRQQSQGIKAINISASWLKGWLSRYGLAVVLAVYAIVDRADLLRSHPCQQSCSSTTYHADQGGGGGPELSESLLQDLPEARWRMLQAVEAGVHAYSSPAFRVMSEMPDVDSEDDYRRLSSDGSSSSSGGHSSHPHEAMFFAILALVVGTSVTHALSFPLFKGLQETVVLFVAGVTLSAVLEGFDLTDKTAVFGRSYKMWMDIDGHLLLFTLLPPLVTGDAMSIDTTVAKRVAKQCMFLAGPGVAIAGFACAGFLKLYLPYDWPFLLCLVSGAILCATDPVAVVALLKELGASPTLTVQIQGESLLNDGTAIVLYTIAYNMLSGKDYDVGDIIMFLVKMAIYAWGLGCLIGFVFYKWIKIANNKLNHESVVIQVSLTICCAYTSFIIAEGGFHISGVLSTVAAAGVLAHKMWPEVVSKESMETTWHMLEYLGNTMIFFLAGALSGKVMVRIKAVDYIHLIVIYFACLIIRGSLFFGFRPLMKYLHSDRHPVTGQEAAVMTWGGLRGAIGLALAIQVNVGKANDNISQDDADRVLFYVSGIAALTLVVNATTCPAVVRKLGVTAVPATKRIMMSIINRQLLELLKEKTKPGRVRNALVEVLDEVEHHIQAPPRKLDLAKEEWNHALKAITHGKALNAIMAEPRASHRIGEPHRSNSSNSLKGRESVAGDTSEIMARIAAHTKRQNTIGVDDRKKSVRGRVTRIVFGAMEDPECEEANTLVDAFLVARQKYKSLPAVKRAPKLAGLVVQDVPLQDAQEAMIKLVKTHTPDIKILKAVQQCFLHIVRSQYWRMIEHGDFFDNEAEQVLTSITEALSSQTADLTDFSYIEPFIQSNFAQSNGRMSVAFQTAQNEEADAPDTCLHRFLDSAFFVGAISSAIVATTVITLIESEMDNEEEKKKAGWVVTEIFFAAVFLLEFLLKFCDRKLKYFQDISNCFDFLLVIIGIVGCVFTIMWVADGSSGEAVPGSETRLVRVVQVFRMMRIFRLFRLWVFFNTLSTKCCGGRRKTTKYSLDLAEHMQKTGILLNFSRAHMTSQEKLVKFFGQNLGTSVDMCEVARTILQSHTFVYEALYAAEIEAMSLKPKILSECAIAEENRAVAEDCEHFIAQACKDGVITAHESEEFLHTIHSHVHKFMKTMQCIHFGQTERDFTSEWAPTKSEAALFTPSADPMGSDSLETLPLRNAREEPPKGDDDGKNAEQGTAQPGEDEVKASESDSIERETPETSVIKVSTDPASPKDLAAATVGRPSSEFKKTMSTRSKFGKKKKGMSPNPADIGVATQSEPEDVGDDRALPMSKVKSEKKSQKKYVSEEDAETPAKDAQSLGPKTRFGEKKARFQKHPA